MFIAPLHERIILLVSGRDAGRYLDARLTNSIRTLNRKDCCLAAALTAQGKTQALFAVMRLDDELFLLMCDGGEREQVLTEFKRFLVADRVNVEDVSDSLTCIHLTVDESTNLPQLDLASFVSGNFEFDSRGGWLGEKFILPRTRTATPGFDLIGPTDHVIKHQKRLMSLGAKLISPEQLQVLGFRAAIPTFPDVVSQNTFFAEAGLESAISFKKGCYVGQEAIERVHAIGKLPKAIQFFSVKIDQLPKDTAPKTGDPLLNSADNSSAGQILNAICDTADKSFLLAAQIRDSALEAEIRFGEVPLSRIARVDSAQQDASDVGHDETPT